MLNRTVRSQVAERRGRLNLTNEWIPRVVTPHWKVSFFLSWILPRVKLRRRVYHLGDGANQSSDSQWRSYCSLWDVHPRVWYKAKGKKNWNNQHINERRVIGGGSAVANVKTDKGPRTKVMHRWIMGVCHEFGRLIKNQCMPLLFWRLIYHASHVCWFFSSFSTPEDAL